MKPFLTLTLIVAGLLLGACDKSFQELVPLEDKTVDYKSAKAAPELEVPPDLTRSSIDDTMVVPDISPSGTASLAAYANERGGEESFGPRKSAVLPEQQNIQVIRDGNKRWLLINAPADQVWPKVREFWLENGFLLKIEDPRVGIMETDWAENRADIETGPIRRFMGKLFDSLYSAATRDMFRVRLEQGEDARTTELYLTHQGVSEELQEQTMIWVPRPNDPGLEAELLRRIMVYLGTADKRAKTQLAKRNQRKPRATLVRERNGFNHISIEEKYSRAWRITGLALDRVGFSVEDRDRSRGIYYVRYNDPLRDVAKKEGWVSKLAFWKSGEKPSEEQYQISLAAGDVRYTQVLVYDKNGKRSNNKTASRILTLLYEELK